MKSSALNIIVSFLVFTYDTVFTSTKKTLLTHESKFYLKDFVVNAHNFSYLLNPEFSICREERIRILIYVHSSPKNYKYRQFARETWSNQMLFPQIRTVFMMGKIFNTQRIDSLLAYEFEEFGDIVQEDFHDTYRNLTYKAIMSLKWIKTYCPQVDFIVKVDEDVLLNTYALLEYVETLESKNLVRQKTIMCYLWKRAKVNRNRKSKWYVTRDEIQEDVYLNYCAGAAYIFTPDLPELYFNLSQYVKYFWIDDFYITGQLRSYTNTSLIGIESKYILKQSYSEKFFQNGNKIIFGHFSKKINDFDAIWRRILVMNHAELHESDLIKFNAKRFLP